MKTLILIDNAMLLEELRDYFESNVQGFEFGTTTNVGGFQKYNLKNDSDVDQISSTFDVVISLNCRQIFPPKLVNSARCINFHPGYNPYNRGYYPHVFSIIKGEPVGVTVHEIDEGIDTGRIIYQETVEVYPDDTSSSIYNKILKLESQLFKDLIDTIIDHKYELKSPDKKFDSFNTKRDFQGICELNLEDSDTLENHINLLRALTHDGYNNAYFIKDGVKYYVKISLDRDS